MDAAQFAELAKEAEGRCPVSNASPPHTVTADTDDAGIEIVSSKLEVTDVQPVVIRIDDGRE